MVKEITTSRRRELAREHDINEQYLYQCLTGRRNMSPAEAVRLEAESAGELSRQMLCQGSWKAIWPELCDPAPAHASEPATEGEGVDATAK